MTHAVVTMNGIADDDKPLQPVVPCWVLVLVEPGILARMKKAIR